MSDEHDSGGLSPSDAVESIDSEGEQAAEGHAAAHGTEAVDTADIGSEQTLRDMLMSTGPEKPLSQVDSPWNPDDGGISRVYRGVMKMADFDGLPAIADIGIGVAEWWVSLDISDEEDGQEAETGAQRPPGGNQPA
jgi:hypothetical protein